MQDFRETLNETDAIVAQLLATLTLDERGEATEGELVAARAIARLGQLARAANDEDYAERVGEARLLAVQLLNSNSRRLLTRHSK